MRDENGRFLAGTHWRPHQPFREYEWLYREYVEKQRSSGEIAAEFDVTDAAILFWLKKHGIPRRSISGARQAKHWGPEGESNPMFGKRGAEVPSWKGGVTPDRQAFYSSMEWKAAVAAIMERDNGICKRCGKQITAKRDLHLHHVISFWVEEFRVELTNIVTVCGDCHRFIHSPANRDQREFLELKGGDVDGLGRRRRKPKSVGH